jgi:hypothetical protein
MRRISIGLLTLLLFWPAVRAADDPKDKPDKKPATPAEEYQALVKEYQGKEAAFYKAYGEAKTDEERQKIFDDKYPKAQEFAKRFLKLAEDNAKEAIGFDAADWLVQNVRVGPEMNKALELLAANHVANTKIGGVCLSLGNADSPEAEKLLRAVLAKDSGAGHKAQAMACFGLASYLKNRARRGGNDAEKMKKEAESLFEQAAEKYDNVKVTGEQTVADLAKEELGKARSRVASKPAPATPAEDLDARLAIGKTAPEIEGEDLDGKKFKLSDYRGKVVVLDFWGNW